MEPIQGVALFFIPKPFGKDTFWQETHWLLRLSKREGFDIQKKLEDGLYELVPIS